MTQSIYERPLEEIVARTLHEIRQIAADMPVNEIAANALEAGTIRRILDRLRADGGLRDRDSTDLDVLFGILGRERDHETFGWHEECVGHYYPEIGAVGLVRQVRTLTERGEGVDGMVRRLRSYRHLIEVCTARCRADGVPTDGELNALAGPQACGLAVTETASTRSTTWFGRVLGAASNCGRWVPIDVLRAVARGCAAPPDD